MKTAYIYSAKRTPIGSFMGSLSSLSASRLGTVASKAALDQAQVGGDQIDEIIFGNVLSAGLGQAPARQVALFSDLKNSVPALTINKVCGSGLKAVCLAADRVMLGRSQLVLAGGMENMSQVPFYLRNYRAGIKMGNQELVDGMIFDGLWDVYNQFHMGRAGELCAREFKFTREMQDAFASQSYQKALAAQNSGGFSEEIAAVELEGRKEKIKVVSDEEPGRGKLDQFSKLKPAFEPSGTITAANASSINDGAAALIVGNESFQNRSKPLARIIHSAEFAQAPEWFTTAPIGGIQKLLKEAQVDIKEIDCFEINEAFSVVAMAAQKELGITDQRLNPKGGAVALGHPIGASGARILTTLIYSLKPKQKGVASLCVGGGESMNILIERI